VEWLGQIFEGPTSVRGDGAFQIRMGGHDDDRKLGVLLMNGGQQIQSIDSRHPNVADNSARLISFQAVQKILAVLDAKGSEAVLAEGFLQHPSGRFVVVEYPYGVVPVHVRFL